MRRSALIFNAGLLLLAPLAFPFWEVESSLLPIFQILGLMFLEQMRGLSETRTAVVR